MTRRRNWAVVIAVSDDDPATFGPYTQARAEALAAQFNERTAAMGDKVHDHYDYVHAVASPLTNPGITGLLDEMGLGV